MEFKKLPEFERDFKKLYKKYHSLIEDLKLLQDYLEVYPKGFPPRVYQIDNLGINILIFKVKHFRCKALKQKGAKSGIRVIYSYFETDQRIEFIEIYYKDKDDTDCDKERIKKNYKN